MIGSKNKAEMKAWAHAQAYIALGFALSAAAMLKIDCCPMEGFSPDEVRKILNLEAHEHPVAYLAVGMAGADAAANPYPKFNFPKEELITHL